MLTDAKIAAIKPPPSGQDEHPDHKVTGLRLRVGAGGKKSWIVRRRVGAKVINKKLGSYPPMGLGAARTAAERLIAALARDGSAEAVDRTLRAVADHWIERVAKPKNNSWRLQQRRLEMHVLPILGERKISDIRRAHVLELLDGIEGQILPDRVRAILKTVFRYAMSRDWIDGSPIEGIGRRGDDRARDRVLSMEEIGSIWGAATLSGFPFGQYTQILLLTAQRRTEVAAMRWVDVDLDDGIWTIPASETKSDRRHLVPLSAPAVGIIKALPRFGEFVFTSDGKTHISGYAKGKCRLDSILEASGAKVASWRLHDLRRSAATHMVRLGVLEDVVGRVLNHAPKGVTAKVYALHTYAPEKRSALDRWAAEVMRAVEGGPARSVVQLRG